jgi:hypothetical protein
MRGFLELTKSMATQAKERIYIDLILSRFYDLTGETWKARDILMKRQQQAMLQRMFGAPAANAAPAAPRPTPPFSFACCFEIPAGQSGGRPLPPEQRKDPGPNYRPRPAGTGPTMGGYLRAPDPVFPRHGDALPGTFACSRCTTRPTARRPRTDRRSD